MFTIAEHHHRAPYPYRAGQWPIADLRPANLVHAVLAGFAAAFESLLGVSVEDLMSPD